MATPKTLIIIGIQGIHPGCRQEITLYLNLSNFDVVSQHIPAS